MLNQILMKDVSGKSNKEIYFLKICVHIMKYFTPEMLFIFCFITNFYNSKNKVLK